MNNNIEILLPEDKSKIQKNNNKLILLIIFVIAIIIISIVVISLIEKDKKEDSVDNSLPSEETSNTSPSNKSDIFDYICSLGIDRGNGITLENKYEYIFENGDITKQNRYLVVTYDNVNEYKESNYYNILKNDETFIEAINDDENQVITFVFQGDIFKTISDTDNEDNLKFLKEIGYECQKKE